MNTNLYFTLAQKIAFLEKHGYEVREETKQGHASRYHNDVDFFDFQVLIPYKNGDAKGGNVHHDSRDRERAVDNVFQYVLCEKLLNL